MTFAVPDWGPRGHFSPLCPVEPGARNKPFIEWMDLLKEIQSKGTSVWVPCNTEDIKIYHRELDPNKVFYVLGASSQTEGEATLKWLEENT